ncbi:MAG: restriction endonuclease subunit S [Bacteroidetes bacterium]|jgi:type I restriction enzyme S subunit|nr:restriction endonuclease subunit S [Bacteroidota bacterium]
MSSNYKKLGDYIQPVNERNKDLKVETLLGVSIQKILMPSIANTVGTNMKTYKIIKKNQFAYGPVTSRNGDKISIALLQEFDEAIISQAYTVFEVVDTKKLHPEYLMMWFRRPEFDRYARFKSHGSARETFDWDELCEVELPIPSIEKQQEIVKEYNTVTKRIKLNEQINQKLEETAQALYKHWFVDFEFPNKEGKPYKSSGGEMVYNEELDKEIPVGWSVERLSNITKITMGQSPSGESYNEDRIGKIFYQGRTDFGFRVPTIRTYTTEPKRMAKKGDILMSVRAPVGDLNIASSDCCIGRGLASIRSVEPSYTFYLMRNFKNLFDSNKGTGTIFSSINKDELFDLKVVYHNRNAIIFNSQVKNIDDLIIRNCEEIETLQKLQSLLLAKMTKVEETTKIY